MSPVQSMALEMLMLVEQIEASRKERRELRLALIGKDPDEVKKWFPEWFPAAATRLESEGEIESVVEHAMGGGEVVWEADENAPAPTPEEVEALLRQLSTGSGTLGDLSDLDTGWS